MVTQLKALHLDKGKGKTPGKSQQAVDELEYLVTFNRPITQAMACTMQNLSENIFINMVNLILARRDRYLEYLQAGVKQNTLTALCTAPLHLQSLFLDQLLERKVRKGILLATLTGSLVVITPMLLQLPSHLTHWTESPVYQQIRNRQQGKKGRGKASIFPEKPAKGSKQHK